MKNILILAFLSLLLGCNGKAQKKEQASEKFEVTKSRAEWKSELTDAQFSVLREAATERPFSSPLDDVKEPGVFVCAACGKELYRTEHKFDSGTGWPSFDQPIEGAIGMGRQYATGYQSNEVHCARCGGHLGHVFNDGPMETTGKRYCMNGVAMKFIPDNQNNKS
ncbi:MAG: peptide-methionine (R)-S-oxide reductase MsrB [Salegentibacter sp.]